MTTYANGDRRLGGADCIVGGGGLAAGTTLHLVRALQPDPEGSPVDPERCRTRLGEWYGSS
ncbi:MAG: hypothetical protein ACRDTJ_01010 [Pseudonocardiaceae bacterium]